MKEPVVHHGANEADDLLAQGHCYRIHPNKGFGAFGAPPMKLLAPLSPVSAHPLAQRPGGVAYLVNLMGKSKWQLPADLWFPIKETLARIDCTNMQCATGPNMKIGSIQKDAGLVVHASH
jgi:hypothetical protein